MAIPTVIHPSDSTIQYPQRENIDTRLLPFGHGNLPVSNLQRPLGHEVVRPTPNHPRQRWSGNCHVQDRAFHVSEIPSSPSYLRSPLMSLEQIRTQQNEINAMELIRKEQFSYEAHNARLLRENILIAERSFVPTPSPLISGHAQSLNGPTSPLSPLVPQSVNSDVHAQKQISPIPATEAETPWWSVTSPVSPITRDVKLEFGVPHQMMYGQRNEIHYRAQLASMFQGGKQLIAPTRRCRRCRCPNCLNSKNSDNPSKKKQHICHYTRMWKGLRENIASESAS
ncbi:hypothetical protein FSP39_010975 [Pinctada imbricata]|uniref:Uncharacterized protein n=1 Tax=Pinctada imbricata TaxID=66713 RepID=A0AA88XDM0_PINIB|nr:hypothetical protein FSP39_010975 [Pinctada imbricata]